MVGGGKGCGNEMGGMGVRGLKGRLGMTMMVCVSKFKPIPYIGKHNVRMELCWVGPVASLTLLLLA